MPEGRVQTKAVVTNTTPIVAYRGAGRPEATAAIERAIDLFAAEIGMDPVEVRRKNLIPNDVVARTPRSSARPTTSATTRARSTACSRPPTTPTARRAGARRAAGDPCSSASACRCTSRSPAGHRRQSSTPRSTCIPTDGATVYTGTSPHGQGHATAWSMIAHEETGIPMDHIEVDPRRHRPRARGRRHDGLAVAAAGRRRRAAGVDRARRRGAARSRPSCSRRTRTTSCSTRTPARSTSPARPPVAKTWAELVGRGERSRATRSAVAGGVHRAERRRSRSAPTSRSSRSTPRPARCACSATSPATTRAGSSTRCSLEGQIHGGIAQGAAQALLEEVRYDEDGNPITANLADYAFIVRRRAAVVRGGRTWRRRRR